MNNDSSPRGLRRMPVRVFLILAGALPALGACGGSERTCSNTRAPYQTAQNNPPLKVPPDLSAPNRSEALAVPDAKGSPSAERSACLDAPPSYFRSAGTVARSPEEVVASWAHAWANREAEAVIELYSTRFEAPTDTADSASWLEQRREQVATGPLPDSMVEGLKIEPDGADRRIASFVQKFGVNSLRKELILVRESGSWRIVEERVSGVQ